MTNLDSILKFVEFTHKFQKIIRGVYVAGLDRNENDLEHSGQLALLALYLHDSLKLNLDIGRIIEYALVHDLVETYAGDTDYYLASSKEKDSKAEREHLSKERILKEFPEFNNLEKLLNNYENKSDEEAKFVYALDKLIVKLNVYLDGGRSWKKDKVTLEMFKEVTPKIAQSKDIEKIWNDFVSLVESKRSTLFN